MYYIFTLFLITRVFQYEKFYISDYILLAVFYVGEKMLDIVLLVFFS